MGAGNSKTNNNNDENETSTTITNHKKLYKKISIIATKYILESDFTSLENLADPQYCNNLILLTGDILNKYTTHAEIEYLYQRQQNGKIVNTLDKTDGLMLLKTDIPKIDEEYKDFRKKKLCLGVAKYYVKIAHIFSGIVMTLNPSYKYRDPVDNKIRIVGVYEKQKIPENAIDKQLIYSNICDTKINILSNNNKFYDASLNLITVGPKFCNSNLKRDGTIKSLIDEPGIKELEQLYYDSYNYDSGKFDEMSPETQQIYENDVRTFYKVFTGNSEVPDDIKSFKDIKLIDYHNYKNCKGDDAILKKEYTDTKNSYLFSKYANHIKKMFENTEKNRGELLKILDFIFVYSKEGNYIKINSKLTSSFLDKIIVDARNVISRLYLQCQNDYKEGLKIYQAIIETKIYETTKSQIENLNKKLETFDVPPAFVPNVPEMKTNIIAPIQEPLKQEPNLDVVVEPVGPLQPPIVISQVKTEPVVLPEKTPDIGPIPPSIDASKEQIQNVLI